MVQLETKQRQIINEQIQENKEFEDFWYTLEIEKIWLYLQKKFQKDFDYKTFSGIVKNILASLKKNYNKDETKNIFLKFWKAAFEQFFKVNSFKLENIDKIKVLILKNYNNSKIINKEMYINKKEADTKEIKLQINETIESLSSLYLNIDSKYKWSDQEIQYFKSQNITPDIEAKLKNTNISIDDYIKYRFTSQKLLAAIKEYPIARSYEFIKSFNQLNSLLDIDVNISFDDGDSKTNEIIQSKPYSLSDFKNNSEKVLDNQDINDFVHDNQQIIEKLNIKYDKKILEIFLDDETPNLLNYVDDNLIIKQSEIKKEFKTLEDQKKAVKIITSKISEFVERCSNQLDKTINQTTKQTIITNCFQALSLYFDRTTSNIQNFADDFKLNINDDISFDGNMIYIQWDIKWSHIWLYYDLQTWEILMDDFMAYVNQDSWWTYNVWIHNWIREKIKIKLPKYLDLIQSVRSIDFKKLINSSKNIQNFKTDLKSTLNNNIIKNFTDINLNKYYIEQFNEKNIAEQSILSDIFYNREITNWIPIINFKEKNKISKNLNPQKYQLINLLFNSLENYQDPDKLREFRDCIARFNLIINSKQVKESISNDPMINKLFSQESMQKNIENWKNNQWEINYFTFFDLIAKEQSNKKIINLELFKIVLTILEKKEDINDNIDLVRYERFMDKYREKYNDPELDF